MENSTVVKITTVPADRMNNNTVSKIITVCSWCGAFISEAEYPATKFSHRLAVDGICISHGCCSQCCEKLRIKYGLSKKGERKNG